MRWRKIKTKVSFTYSLGGSIQLSIKFELTGSYNLMISEYLGDIMLHFCTARLDGIDAKYASYSFVQECIILADLYDSKRATEDMNKVDMDLLREQLAQFRHLQAPEHESGGRSPRTLQWRGDDWIEIYPSVEALQEVGDESQVEYNFDSEAGDA